MNLLYFDAHMHFEEYGDNATATAVTMGEKGIGACAVSVRPTDYKQISQLSKENSCIIPAMGIHPWHAAKFAGDWDALEQDYKNCRVIGEIGLDKKWTDPNTFRIQQEVFHCQLEFACRYQKPVNVHTSGADQEVLQMLRSSLPPGVVIHWFDGPMKFLYQYLDLGCYMSVASDVNSSRRKRRICRGIPKERLLCETDGAKAIAWGLKRAVSSEDYLPDAIIRIYEATATACGIQPNNWEEFYSQVTQNARDAFRI